MKVKSMVNRMEKFTKKNSPTILTVCGLIGLVGTGYLAYKAGLEADEILKEKKKEMEMVDEDDKEAKNAVRKETIAEITPVIAPPIIMGIVTGACIIGSNTANSRRIAALSAAYTLSETAAKDLSDKVTEMLGEKKLKEMKGSIAKDKLKKDKNLKEKEVIVTGNGTVLCMDMYRGRPFYSNAQKIGEAINELSSRVQVEMYVSLNDFYDLLKLPPIPIGEDLGWCVDDLDHGRLPIDISAELTEEKVPCLCVDFDIKVRPDFRNLC